MPRRRKAEAAEVQSTDTSLSPKDTSKSKANEKKPEETVTIQYGGNEWELAALKEKVYAAYVAEGHRRGNVKKLVLYVKPEEQKAYYAINDKASGGIDFE